MAGGLAAGLPAGTASARSSSTTGVAAADRRRVLRRFFGDDDARQLHATMIEAGYRPAIDRANVEVARNNGRGVGGAAVPYDRDDGDGAAVLVWRDGGQTRAFERQAGAGWSLRRLEFTGGTVQAAYECTDVNWTCVGGCIDSPWTCGGRLFEGTLDCCDEWSERRFNDCYMGRDCRGVA